MNGSDSIVWRCLFRPGHEYARLQDAESGFRLDGVAVFIHDAMACRLDYAIMCDVQWRTQHVAVTGWVGADVIDYRIDVTADGVWQLNGIEQAGMRGCVDIDLHFSPVTNLLPIRRCRPKVGDVLAVRAAWLRFPSFALEPLEQTYRRLSGDMYEYTSGGGAFTAELAVNDCGFVVEYAGGWVREEATQLAVAPERSP